MKYDFDQIIPRKNTGCVKYDLASAMNVPGEAIPMWVADMDFQAPPEVTRRIREFADLAVYGYNFAGPQYFQAVRNWFQSRFDFAPEADWLVRTPGVVYAVSAAVRALTREGEAVIIQQPVYHPFPTVVTRNKRRLVVSELVEKNGRYTIDLEDFERKIVSEKVKMFILCSPHNPVGRVWTEGELKALGDICLKHGCLIVSDEIHCDFVAEGHRHHVFPALSEQLAQITVLCTAPSKSFNLAGLQASNIFIPNEDLRRQYKDEIGRAGLEELNAMGLVACRAAYEEGGAWLDQLKDYLAGNFESLRRFLAAEMPQVKLIEPEGTYLAWLDFRALGRDPRELNGFLANQAKVWLDDGLKFGPAGAGFQRMNLACPRSVVEKALGQLAEAVGRS